MSTPAALFDIRLFFMTRLNGPVGIGMQIRPGKADGTGGAERPWFRYRHDRLIVVRRSMTAEKIDHCLGPVSQAQHDPFCPEVP